MALGGRIRDDDIAAVKERTRIEDVVGDQVALRRAGTGSLKGLCPFHDEKTPSFHVRPALGLYHCFGCGEGGDVIAFVMAVDHLSFAEAVERLAARAGVELHRDESGSGPVRPAVGQRQRLVDANAVAAQYYTEQLLLPAAAAGRELLARRGFDRAAAERFGLGFAPRGGEELLRHLRGRGYTEEELLTAGLAARSGSGRLYDRFRGRLLWPIRDLTGDVVGFGARRLFDDDRIEAKYLNTPDTPLYRKSHVLYGVDLAKREIARQRRVVVVEGYTDVMACHLAGVTTAVATCGTAFGEDHARIVRRLLGDSGTVGAGGKVVFTFDGDAAGQKAAQRAYAADQQFVARTFVAVAPDGQDPCELRQVAGNDAVSELVERAEPLFEFVIRSRMAGFDLDTEEGRLAALDAAAPVVAGIKDRHLQDRYAVGLDKWAGILNERLVRDRVRLAARRARQGPGGPGGRGGPVGPGGPSGPGGSSGPGGPREHGPVPFAAPGPTDPVTQAEEHALACALQQPELVGESFDALGEDAFTVPAHRVIHDVIVAAGGASGAKGRELTATVRELAPSTVGPLVLRLAMSELPVTEAGWPRFAAAVVARLGEMEASRAVLRLRRRLHRLDEGREAEEYRQVSRELHEATLRQRALREKAEAS